jgi:hypothetical protein
VSAFSAWTGCTKSCGKGSQSRSRAIRTRADHGGYACPYLKETRTCNEQSCAVDCIVNRFGAWSTCTKSCGAGSQERSRRNTPPTMGGKACPHSAETRACNTAACAINCKFGDFSKWTACTLSCGTGSQKRSRATTEPQNGGKACPHAAETRACNAAPCPINGGWTAWAPWSACSKDCDGGVSARARTCTSPAPQFGGKPCPNHAGETKNCNMHVCNCPSCTFKNGHLVVGHTTEHLVGDQPTHGPRQVHAHCAKRGAFAHPGFCGKSFVMAHRCRYSRDTDKCSCVCRKPTKGQKRDHHVIRHAYLSVADRKDPNQAALKVNTQAAMWKKPAEVVTIVADKEEAKKIAKKIALDAAKKAVAKAAAGVAAAAKVAAKKAADASNALKAAAAQLRKDDLAAAAQKLKDAAAVAEKSAKKVIADNKRNHEKSIKAAAAKAKALAKQAADRVVAAERKVKDLEIVKKAKAAVENTAKSAERGAKNVERSTKNAAKAVAKKMANMFRGF